MATRRVLNEFNQFVPLKDKKEVKPVEEVVEQKKVTLKEEIKKELPELPTDLADLTAVELKALCKERNLSYKGNSSKASLIALLSSDADL